jgi:signal transduction histidine kinase/DNA-binding NarL/FixJ family response regulator
VLLIEDNPGDARLIREMLRDADHRMFQLDTAETLTDGLQHLEWNLADVVLLDLSLPDSVGVETLERLKGSVPHVAIVVLTGYNGQDLGLQAVQMGAQDYLIKGETEGPLLARALRYAVERQRIDEAMRRSDEEYRSLINDVFDTSTVAVLILDRDYEVVWCNEATEIYFGVPREELLGEDSRVLIDTRLKCVFDDPDDYARRLLEAYSTSAFTDRFECHVLPGPGREERWLEHWSQPIRSGMYTGGRIEQYTDITQRKRLELREAAQRHYAEALASTAALLTSTLNIDEVLDRVLSNIERVVPHDAANIMLRNRSSVQVVRYTGSTSVTSLSMHDAPALLHMVESGSPIIIADAAEQNWVWPVLIGHEKMHAYVGVPIKLREQVIGFINVFNRAAHTFDPEVANRLLAFAGQAAIGIQNARLYSQSQELATIKERQRLARDLHDSVSQTLFTSKAMAESALRQWETNPQRAYELLNDVHDMSATALAEMRVLLLELRPASLDRVDLRELFEQYLEPIQSRRQLEVNLEIPDEVRPPPKVRMAFYRIVQEALNNIEKHSRATTVDVGVIRYDNRLELEIRDNGRGFSVEQVNPMSLGLNIMRERAEEIAATFSIESAPNRGTHIQVIWHHANEMGNNNG